MSQSPVDPDRTRDDATATDSVAEPSSAQDSGTGPAAAAQTTAQSGTNDSAESAAESGTEAHREDTATSDAEGPAQGEGSASDGGESSSERSGSEGASTTESVVRDSTTERSDREDPADEEDDDHGEEAGSTQALPAKLTFRITGSALIAVLIVAVCMSPLALSAWLLAPLFLVPIAMAVWVMRVRTVVTRERISASSLFRTTTVAWEDVQSLRLDERRWVRLVLPSDREVTLPAVRVRDLPNLAAMSGGRLSDPTATIPGSDGR